MNGPTYHLLPSMYLTAVTWQQQPGARKEEREASSPPPPVSAA